MLPQIRCFRQIQLNLIQGKLPLTKASAHSQNYKIALGLSSGSWPLLQRLKKRSHINKVALTRGAASGLENLPNDLLIGSAKEILRQYWNQSSVIIVVGAIGATTRLIAPLLSTKEQDPAVVVLDAIGTKVVPLIGGHQAGGEDLAIQLAEDLGADPVLTGDSITQGRLSLDSFGEAWGWKRMGDRENWNELMFSQARGWGIKVLQQSGSKLWQTTKGAVASLHRGESDSRKLPNQLFIGPKSTNQCSWHPATLWVGIGCERNSSPSLLSRSLNTFLKEAGFAEEAVAGLGSIDLKSNEPALLSLSKEKKWPIKFFSPYDLAQVAVPNPSEVVKIETGTPSVAEASSLLAAGHQSLLLKEKTICYANSHEEGAITIALAEARQPFSPDKGELHLVGSGPGDLTFLTNDARWALSRTVVWVGYGPYLDQLEPLRRDYQVRIDGELTFERDRCIKALELASQGIRVALISSGDSGIYGMAGLALELWLEKPNNERPRFEVHPGISAIQLAASRFGAPIMNDFCAISLSDRLTPWEIIEKRIICAAKGDFVIALYNPQSKGRDWQLKRAIDLLLEYRIKTTPVALARQIGRQEEQLHLYTLNSLPFKEVDMLTILLVGNSRSLVNDGWFVTPRGYSIK